MEGSKADARDGVAHPAVEAAILNPRANNLKQLPERSVLHGVEDLHPQASVVWSR